MHGQSCNVLKTNAIIRLNVVGTFGRVEYVFLVGVGGGVANHMDDSSHVRLGDLVVSRPDFNCGPVYLYCNGVDQDPSGGMSFSTQSWNTREDIIEKMVIEREATDNSTDIPEWEGFMNEGMAEVSAVDNRFYRPKAETDRLFKNINGKLIEVSHPDITPGSVRDQRSERPVVHYGLIGAGQMFSKEENLRRDFSLLNEIKALDCGFQAAMNSIDGNCKDSFVIIRGIADYGEGLSKREWQPYAAMAAAGYMKSLVLALPPVQ